MLTSQDNKNFQQGLGASNQYLKYNIIIKKLILLKGRSSTENKVNTYCRQVGQKTVI